MKYNTLIPELMVSDIKRSLSFYIDVLGFNINYEREKFVFISLGDVQMMLEEVQADSKWQRGRLEEPFGNGINFQIIIEDLDSLYEKVQENNLEIFQEIEENIYKTNDGQVRQREFLVEDPDGYLLRFTEIKH